MDALTKDPSLDPAARFFVNRTRLPEGLEVHQEIGKGSNNKVFRASFEGRDCALRVPRRRSDTQQRGSAVWEFRHTLRASQLGVGPEVYSAWCARHATGRWPSGLYVITERLPHDLETVLCDDEILRGRAVEHSKELGEAIVACLKKLADELIFVYDLKPSNVMIRFRDEGVDVRIIDFGRDFCEWAGCEQDPDSNTPIVTMLRRRLRARGEENVDATVSHVLFAAMLVELAATTTRRLHEERPGHRMNASERAEVNPVSSLAEALLDSMQGRNKALLREVLRTDDVRGVLRHYHGRRDSGTRRTLQLAVGNEV